MGRQFCTWCSSDHIVKPVKTFNPRSSRYILFHLPTGENIQPKVIKSLMYSTFRASCFNVSFFLVLVQWLDACITPCTVMARRKTPMEKMKIIEKVMRYFCGTKKKIPFKVKSKKRKSNDDVAKEKKVKRVRGKLEDAGDLCDEDCKGKMKKKLKGGDPKMVWYTHVFRGNWFWEDGDVQGRRVMVDVSKNSSCKLEFFKYFDMETDLKEYDWCGVIMDAIKRCKDEWKKCNLDSKFLGPLVVLKLLYCDRMPCPNKDNERKKSPLELLTMENLKKKEEQEINNGDFEMGELRGI